MAGPSRNPYIAGRALSAARGFCGRDDVFRVVQAELEQADRNAIVLFGQRRIGKTSILLNLRTRLPSPPFVAVYFDLMDRARKSLADVLYEIAQNIAGELDLPSPAREDFGQDGVAFRRIFLPSIYAALGPDKRLVLLLDEFDVLDVRQEEQLPNTSAARAFFPYLRELMMNEPQLGFVFVVGRKAGELSTDFKAAFKAARYYRISMLDEPAARTLALTAQRDGTLTFGDGAVDRILALTACHPYFTQLVCQLLFERAYQDQPVTDKPPCVSVEDVNAVIARALEAGENVYEWIWDGLPPAERVIFSAVATGTEEGSVVTEERLLSVLQDSGVRILVRELELAPKTLIEWEMLKQADGGYRFVVELMRRWVASRKPLAKVKDELDRINPLADMLYQVATSFYRSGQVDNAIAQLQQATSVNPNHLKARLLLGELYKVQGRLDNMLREFAEAYRIDEDASRVNYEAALILCAETYEKNDEIDEATKLLSQALYVTPNSRVARERLAAIQAQQKHRQAEQYVRAAQDAASQQRWDDAVAAYGQLAALDEADPRWREELNRATRERDLAQLYSQGVSSAAVHNWVEAQKRFGDVVSQRANYKDAITRLDVATRELEREKEQGGVVPDSRRTLLIDWLLGTTVGWLLGALIAGLLTVPSTRPDGTGNDAMWLISPLLGSGIATIFQWLVLDARVARAWLWLVGTVGGLAGSIVLIIGLTDVVRQHPSPAILDLLFAALLAVAALILPGVTQALILRRYVRHAWWWIAAHALSWIAGLGVFAVLSNWSFSLIRGSPSRAGLLFEMSGLGAVFGIVLGSGTGLVLARLFSPGTITALSFRPRRLLPTVTGAAAMLIAIAGALVLNRPPEDLVRTFDISSPHDVAFSPDGATVAVADWADRVELRKAGDSTLLTTITSTGPISNVVFAPDGTTIATNENDGIQLRQVSDGMVLQTLSGYTGTVRALTMSPDGQHVLALMADGSLRMWQVQDGALEHEYTGFGPLGENNVGFVGFNADGKSFVADGTFIAVWDVNNPQAVVTTGKGLAESFAAAGAIVAVQSYDSVSLYHSSDLRKLTTAQLPYSYSAFALSPDGVWLAASDVNWRIHLFHIASDYQLVEARVYDNVGYPGRLIFSPDNHLLLSIGYDSVRLWRMPEAPNQAQQARPTSTGTGIAALQLSQVLTGHTSAVYSVAYDPSGKLMATGSNDETIILWDFSNAKSPTPSSVVLHGHNSAVNSLAFSPDGKVLASGSQDMSIRLWDVSNPSAPVTLTAPLVAHHARVSGLAFAPSGKVLASASYDNDVILWDVSDVKAPRLLKVLAGHTNKVQTVAFSPDGKTLASGSFDHTIILWDVSNPATAQPIGNPLTKHTNWVMSLAFSPDGRILASGGNDEMVILWDMTDARAPAPLRQLKGHTDTVQGVAINANGKLLVTTGDDGQLMLWNIADAKAPVQSGPAQFVTKGIVWAVAFNPGGGQVATADDNGDVKLWDVSR